MKPIIIALSIFLSASIALNVYVLSNFNLKGAVKQPRDSGTYETISFEDANSYFSLNEMKDCDYEKGISKETALDIGNDILYNEVFGYNMFEKTEYRVYDVKDKNFYIVHRKPKSLYGSLEAVVEINKKDGRVMKLRVNGE